MAALVKPNVKAPSQDVRVAELTLEANYEDRTVEEVSAILPADTRIGRHSPASCECADGSRRSDRHLPVDRSEDTWEGRLRVQRDF